LTILSSELVFEPSGVADQFRDLELVGWTIKTRGHICLILNIMGLHPEEEIWVLEEENESG
jgi:hypothetical protein